MLDYAPDDIALWPYERHWQAGKDDLAKGRTTSEAQNRMPCVKKVLKIRLLSDIMKTLEGAAQKEAGRSWYDGVTFMDKSFAIPISRRSFMKMMGLAAAGTVLGLKDDAARVEAASSMIRWEELPEENRSYVSK